jgi:hypothetical protein
VRASPAPGVWRCPLAPRRVGTTPGLLFFLGNNKGMLI